MKSSVAKEKTLKDLTISEFEGLIRRIIADDIESWKATFDIMGDRHLMAQIRKADRARRQGVSDDYIPWEEVRRDV